MIPKPHLQQAIFLKRYKRFFADIEIDGSIHQAHVPNTGSLSSCLFPQSPCLVSKAEDPQRKLPYTLHALQVPTGSWVGVDTSWPGKLVREAFEEKKIDRWKAFDFIHSEVKINPKTRLDFLMISADQKRKHYVEVKNVTLARGGIENCYGTALFPDAVTLRGQKHLKELMQLWSSEQGISCEILFVIQRLDCDSFTSAENIDPIYSELLRKAKEHGVWVHAHRSVWENNQIKLGDEVRCF